MLFVMNVVEMVVMNVMVVGSVQWRILEYVTNVIWDGHWERREMTEKPYDDSNWREEYKGYTSSRYELDILENGPRSLAQSWMLGALHNKWKKMKGITEPDPPDCQSSLKEWEAIAKKYENPPEAFGPGGPLTDQAGSGTH